MTPPADSPQLVVERIDALAISGWAADRLRGVPHAVTLTIDGQPAAIPIERQPRGDVAHALGLPSGDFGFSIALPPEVWRAGGKQLRALQVHAGSAQFTVADARSLWAHAERTLTMPAGPERAQAAKRCLAHWAAVQPVPAWPTDTLAALRRACLSIRAHIESISGGVCTGWAWAEGEPDETVALHDGAGRCVSTFCLRTERGDVQAALNTTRPLLGFELEVPPTIWAQADANASVQLTLWVQGEPAATPAIVWHRETLLADLAAAHAGHLAHVLPEDRDYRLRHLIHHALAAGLWPMIPFLQQEWLHAQALRLGVADALPPPAAPPAPPDERSELDRALHRALAEVNAQVVPGDPQASLAAMGACIARQLPASELRHLLGLSLLPHACALGQYVPYRAWLDTERVLELRHADDCWALSLLLPELIVAGDVELATTVTARMPALPGWLNTECVAFAVAHLAAHWPESGARAGAAAWLDAVSRLLHHLCRDYWGRGHDAHLMATQATLMRLTTRLPAAIADALLQRAVQAHGLVPDFWARLQAAWPERDAWPAALQAAHCRWLSVAASWAAQADPGTALAELAALPDWLDSPVWARATLARHAGDMTPEQAVTAAHLVAPTQPLEFLRLAAHPAASADVAAQFDAAWGGLREAVARASGLPHTPHERVRAAWLAALDGGGPPPALDTLRDLAATGEDHGWSLLIAAWWLRRTPQDAPALALARELGEAACAQMAPGAAPPQPLVQATRMLWNGGAGPAHELARAWGAHLGQAAPEVWARVQLAPADASFAELPLHRRTLVAVLSSREQWASQLAAISASWGAMLTAHQVPWCGVVGDGDGTLRAHTLALPSANGAAGRPSLVLDLLSWLLTHTECEHLLCVPGDTHLNVPAWLARQPHVPHHHHGRPAGPQGEGADAQPPHADGAAGFALSRWAMAAMLEAARAPRLIRRTRGVAHEDQLLGQLAAACGLPLASADWAVRVPAGANTWPYPTLFAPGPLSSTLLAQTRDGEPMAELERLRTESRLQPGRIWPCDGPARLAARPHTNHLELLSPAARAADVAGGAPIVVAVMRNERLMLPHFLAHYRRLGVRHFVLVDNGSDDGSRAFALSEPGVLLYAADTPYRESHHGVAWQQAVLAAHGHGRWAVLADLDEFLIYPECETRPLTDWLAEQDAQGADAVRTLLIDMYPEGDLDDADFSHTPPFEAAPCFDREPLRRWSLGSGRYANGQTVLSGLRHRLAPGSAPNFFTSQKVAVLRHQPWMRLSDGLHDMAGMRLAGGAACFAHFKYHAGFRRKVEEEVRRKQHFNGAEEYRRYLAMVSEARPRFFDAVHSAHFQGSADWAAWMVAADNAPEPR